PYSGVIAIFVKALSEGRPPTIFGDGEQTRDFVYVSDVVQALCLAALTPGVSGEVFNVGAGGGVSLLRLLTALNALLGTSLAPKHAEARAGDVRHSRADVSRAGRRLGYSAKVPFEEGLRRTL